MRPSVLLNLILFTIVVILAIFLFFEMNKHDAGASKAAQNWQKVESLSDNFDKRVETWPAGHEQGGTTIDTSMANIYIQNYRATEQRYTPDTNRITQSVWVDAASLSSMMKTIIAHNGDGIRVYFSRYPALSAVPDPKRYDKGSYDNRLSFVIYTTKAADGNGATHDDVYYFKNAPVAKRGLGIISTAQAAPALSGASGYNYEGSSPPEK
ncbi:MAG: hypothetical protein LBE82_04925 [Chitinophagaceae bacterium]|jgi:hypothetical protein|nr:hypothetical protein [Chitinophagaceae bacterium]